MRIRRYAPSTSTVVFASLWAIGAVVPGVHAQDLPNLTKGGGDEGMPSAQSTDAKTAADTKTAAADTKSAKKTGKTTGKATATGKTAAKTTAKPASKTDTASASDKSAATPTSLSSSQADPSSIPLPTIAGQYSYPPPSVPPTANAPFMQHSTLPEGTVFIAVGAGLGFLALAVLAWHGLVAWSLHRSVKRAARQQNVSDQKTFFRPPGGGKIYSSSFGSSMSLDHLAYGNRHNHQAAPSTVTNKSHAPPESLFFSPTANRKGSVIGLDAGGNRNSGYLPAGYYAAGNSAPGGSGGKRDSSMSQLSGAIINAAGQVGAKSQGYSKAQSMGPSPPSSPSLRPTSRGAESILSRAANVNGSALSGSESNLNLNHPPQGRAPSAYLEDLFESQPPAGTRASYVSQGR